VTGVALGARMRGGRAAEAAFTLIELMVVVIIISIVCVLAIPTLSHEGYERRAYRDAANVAELVREARTRAVARGAAELLVMSASPTTNTASFMLYEAVAGPAGTMTPASSCGAPTVWPGAGTATANFIDGFQIAPSVSGNQTIEGSGNINMRINDPTTGLAITTAALYLCFTPAGRTWYLEAGTPTPPFLPLGSICSSAGNCVGAVTVDVTIGSFPSGATGQSSSSSLIRTVWIPPSGSTRITAQ
jgi:prepilin-type N-terminal cleavage/methylation domain-containing protein